MGTRTAAQPGFGEGQVADGAEFVNINGTLCEDDRHHHGASDQSRPIPIQSICNLRERSAVASGRVTKLRNGTFWSEVCLRRMRTVNRSIR